MERWYEGSSGTEACKRSGEVGEQFQRSLKRLNMAAVEASHHEEQGKEGIMLSSFRRRLYRWLTQIAGRSVRSNTQLMRFNQHSPRSEIDWTPLATRLSLSYWVPRQIHGPAAHRRLSTEGLGRLKPKGAMDR
ncbi:hypothetical protein N7524_008736 [Penicillium chrysogenum]|jgi:hypothetical protein|nr:hypothetical protein N7524_008736 [Penicillium chrysogenum]